MWCLVLVHDGHAAGRAIQNTKKKTKEKKKKSNTSGRRKIGEGVARHKRLGGECRHFVGGIRNAIGIVLHAQCRFLPRLIPPTRFMFKGEFTIVISCMRKSKQQLRPVTTLESLPAVTSSRRRPLPSSSTPDSQQLHDLNP